MSKDTGPFAFVAQPGETVALPSRAMNRHPMLRRAAAALALAALLQACVLKERADAEPGGGRPWVAAWGSAQLALEPLPAASAPAPAWVEPLRDVSLRQVLRITADGEQLRVRVSNLLGRTPLELGAAAVAARDASAAADGQPPAARAETMRALHFAGQAALVLAPGEEAWSDPVDLPVTLQSELLVDLHVRQGVAPATAHPGSRIRSWAAAGMQVGRPNWAAAAPRVGWWHLAALDVRGRRAVPVLVAIGDSITDGYGVPPGSYQRWPDLLAQRLAGQGVAVSVVNTGIGGNRLLRDGLGPSVLSRFERDALARSGATHAVLLIGVNDFGVQRRNREDSPAARAALLQQLQQALRTLSASARARGVCLAVSTVLPYGNSGYYQPGPDNEADRLTLNTWIRGPAGFDAVVDFDALVRDPARPERMRAELDSGDGLHPSMAGYRAMADAFPLPFLERRCGAAAR